MEEVRNVSFPLKKNPPDKGSVKMKRRKWLEAAA